MLLVIESRRQVTSLHRGKEITRIYQIFKFVSLWRALTKSHVLLNFADKILSQGISVTCLAGNKQPDTKNYKTFFFALRFKYVQFWRALYFWKKKDAQCSSLNCRYSLFWRCSPRKNILNLFSASTVRFVPIVHLLTLPAPTGMALLHRKTNNEGEPEMTVLMTRHIDERWITSKKAIGRNEREFIVWELPTCVCIADTTDLNFVCCRGGHGLFTDGRIWAWSASIAPISRFFF